MKRIITFLALLSSLVSCTKSDNTTPNNNNTNPYYFKFTLDGTPYNFTSPAAQFVNNYDHSVSGYQTPGILSMYPSVGIVMVFDSVATDADVKSMAGKTFYYNGVNPSPSVFFGLNSSTNTFYSIDTPNHNFNINISSVSYLRKDTTIFNVMDVYVVKGTCSAVLSDGVSKKTLTGGEFNYLISRVYK